MYAAKAKISNPKMTHITIIAVFKVLFFVFAVLVAAQATYKAQ
jgi:hypothetical protein